MPNNHFIVLQNGALYYLENKTNLSGHSLTKLFHINEQTFSSELVYTIEIDDEKDKVYLNGIEFDKKYFELTKISKIYLRFPNLVLAATIRLFSGFLLNPLLIGSAGIGISEFSNSIAQYISTHLAPAISRGVGAISIGNYTISLLRSGYALHKANYQLDLIKKEKEELDNKRETILKLAIDQHERIDPFNMSLSQMLKVNNKQLDSEKGEKGEKGEKTYKDWLSFIELKKAGLEISKKRWEAHWYANVAKIILSIIGIGIGALAIGISAAFVPYLILSLAPLFSATNFLLYRYNTARDNEALSNHDKRYALLKKIFASDQEDVILAFIKKELGIETDNDFGECLDDLKERLRLKYKSEGCYLSNEFEVSTKKYNSSLRKDFPLSFVLASLTTVVSLVLLPLAPTYIIALVALAAQIIISSVLVFFLKHVAKKMQQKPNMSADVAKVIELTKVDNVDNKPEQFMDVIVNLDNHAGKAGVAGQSSTLNLTTDDLKDAIYISDHVIGREKKIEDHLKVLEKKLTLQSNQEKNENRDDRVKIITAITNILSKLINFEKSEMRKIINTDQLYNEHAKKLWYYAQKLDHYQSKHSTLSTGYRPMYNTNTTNSPSFFSAPSQSKLNSTPELGEHDITMSQTGLSISTK